MNTLARLLVFGTVSGLLWSVAPGVLADLFSARADIPAIVTAGVIAGIVTSAILAPLLTRFNRGVAICFGLLSLPLGAFVFGFSFASISRFLPALRDGRGALLEPFTLGSEYALLSVVSVFAIGLFPLAAVTTMVLRSFINRGGKTPIP